jgi:hypothetical protein
MVASLKARFVMRPFLVALFALSLVPACKYEKAPMPKLSDEPMIIQTAKADDPFVPPADGRLRAEQVLTYIDAQEKAKTAGETGALAYARSMGVGTAEYNWVKEQIREASGSEIAAREVRARSERSARWEAAGLELTKGQLRQALAEAPDEPTRQRITDMLANYDRLRAEMERSLAADRDLPILYNRQLIAAHACRPEEPAAPCLTIEKFE